jgi:staphylococcal nuclease domain-containing protein 1
VPLDKDYGLEALDRFRQLTEVRVISRLSGLYSNHPSSSQGHRLIANVDQREGQLLHLRLIDPQDPNSATDPMACLNADLVREGEPFGWIAALPPASKLIPTNSSRSCND